MTRTEFFGHRWDDSFDGMSNAIDMTGHRLRCMIDDDRKEILLHTAKGVGHVLKPERQHNELRGNHSRRPRRRR